MKVLSKSLFGNVDKLYAKRLFKHYATKKINNWNFLLVDDKDGYLGMYPLSYGGNLTVYEPNKKFLYGGLVSVPIKMKKNKLNSFYFDYYINLKYGIINSSRIKRCLYVWKNTIYRRKYCPCC